MKKQVRKRMLAFLLAVCLCLGMIPADLLGGVARVQAAEAEAASYVSYQVTEETTTSRTRMWDFKTDKLSSSSKVAVGDTVQSVIAQSGTIYVKNTNQGLSLAANSSVAIPLKSGTTSVSVSFELTSNNSARYLVVGNDAVSQKVYHSNAHADYNSATDGVLVNKAFSGTYDSSYFTGDTLVITAKEGESKIGTLTVVETISGSTSDGDGGTGGETVAYTDTYDFTNGSIIPADTDGKQTVTTANGRLTVACGPSNAYSYNGTHGVQFKTGNTITISVYGDTTIAVGKCTYSAGTVSLSKDGTEIAAGQSLKGACAKDDPAAVAVFDYTGEACDLVLNFTDGSYVPFIKVSGEMPKPAVTEVEAAISVGTGADLLTNGITIVNTSDSTDTYNVTAAGGNFTLKANASYKLVTGNDDIEATVNGKTTFTTGTEAVSIEIAVAETFVMLTPVVTGSELGNNVLYAVNGSNEIALTNGTEVKLPRETKYSLVVKDASGNELSDWTAKVKGESGFTTAASGPQSVEIVVTHVAEVMVTPTVVGKGLLDTNKIYFTDADGNKYEVKDGTAMALKPNTKYTVSIETASGSAASGLEVSVGAKTEYTTGTENAEITINVSTPATRSLKYTNFTKANSDTGNGAQTEKTVLFGSDKAGVVLESSPADGSATPGILYFFKGTSSGCSYDGQLRFRPGVILYFPIKEDTTKVAFIQTSNANQPTRKMHIGGKGSGYELAMTSGDASITVEDITDLVKEVNGQRYLPVESDGDVKLNAITLVEYNPVNEVTLSGTVKDAAKYGVTEIAFKNLDDENAAIVKAAVDAAGNYSVVLRRVGGATNYAATIAAAGCKIQDENDADKFLLSGNGTTAVQNFAVVEAPTATVSGTVTGIREDRLKGDLGVALIPDNPAIPAISLTLTKSSTAGTYKFENLVLDIGRSYTVQLTNADDEEVLDVIVHNAGDSLVKEIKATAKPVYAVSGQFVTSDDKAASVSSITFTNMETPDYSYTFAVSGGSYTAELRAGEYETSVVCSGYEAFDHVSVQDTAVANDVYLQGAVDTSSVPYAAEIKAGAGQEFTSIADAVAYISRMERGSNDRVTIVLDNNAVYREQLVIDTPNITIQGNGSTITWYYGVGFSYYSAKLSADGKSAYYDEAYAVDKYNKQAIAQNPGHWGATVNLLFGASGFTAEDVTFENSLNRYLTTEELEDGAAENVTASVTDRTKAGIDVRTKNAKERSCALYIQADNTEYKNCSLLSRQDTLYTGDADENSYFVDCIIEGNVDYICGDGNPVFDGCTLSMYGYPEAASTEAYIVANKAKATFGYLFENCKIVQAKNVTRDGSKVIYGAVTNDAIYSDIKDTTDNYLARAWDAGTVFYRNTEAATANMVNAKAYRDMNAKVEDATYYEYNTHLPDGTAVDTSGRVVTKGGVLTKEQSDAIAMTSYFGDWAPIYYTKEDFVVSVGSLQLEITAPKAEAAPDKKAVSSNPGTTLGAVSWYEGDAAYTGATFEGDKVYTAKVVVSLADRYAWAEEVTAEVAGATSVEVQKNADGTVTVIAVYPQTLSVGLYEIDLSNGLKKGVTYDGGISVLEDMPVKSGDGFVQGSSNPLDASGKGAKETIPVSGAAVRLDAQKNGRLKVDMKAASGKNFYFVDAGTDGNTVVSVETFTAEKNLVKVFQVEKDHIYYVYGNGTKICLYGLTVDYRTAIDWNKVAAPVLGMPVASRPGDADQGQITIPFTAQIGGIYSDQMDVKVFLNGTETDTITTVEETDSSNGFSGSVIYKPSASGTYTFQAVLRRDGVVGKTSAMSDAVEFILPMSKPVIVNVENQGSGAAKFSWKEVNEAEAYEVYLNGELVQTVTVPYARFTGLTVGTEYEFGVVAIGNGTRSEMSVMKQTITADAVKSWLYAAFGSGVDTKNNKLLDGIDGKDDTSLSLQSAGGKGKLVPASTDGLAFYYTTIDPDTENFTLSADVTVDEWTYSNGQEGFGLMAADAVGVDGDASVFWNNSYMASVTKVEYYWDQSTQTPSDSGAKYTMKLGVGSQEKKGVSKDNLAEIQGGNLSDFSSAMQTLETSCPNLELPAGTYNIAANYTNNVDMGDVNPKTTFHLTIQRNNTGYFVSYTDENGVTTTNKYYHGDDGDELTKLDSDNIYVGFFASRNARITANNVQLTTINPADDAPAEERPISYVSPKYTIESAGFSNSAAYELVYVGNADGWATVSYAGEVVKEAVRVNANEKYCVPFTLKEGRNSFEVKFTPDPNYCPSKYERLSDYETKYLKLDVNYQTHGRNIIYVAPGCDVNAEGSKENPMSIYRAVMYAEPGDVILLKEGTYNLTSTLTIERGINGTADKNIYMIADPEAQTRPVLDFGGVCAGMIMAGDYWYFQGFDVTNSANGQKGIQVSGSYNTLDNLRAYKNGNTGIQISRYKSSDLWEDWPSNNLILNCTSFLNADAGYEDADGFAAKLTIADGNVFDGCIAAYNADDGWDLFAKIESGPIGQVKLKNCVAFKNGYVIGEDGSEVNAGNGNGFKMGGSSISGHHVLYNSVAFANKAKGIDSNSCPDIMVYSSTSFDNESYNVAFYTNDTQNTDFTASGILSYKKSNLEGENIKLKGLQDESKVYNVFNFFFNGGSSKNTEGKAVSDDWFADMDTYRAIHGGITRNADGTINMNGYLELTAAVPDEVGARMSGMASKVVTLPDLVIKDSTDDDDDDDDNDDDSTVEETPGQGTTDDTASKKDTGTNSTGKTSKPKPQPDKDKEVVKKLVINKDMDWDEVNEALRELIAEAAGGKAVLEVELGKHYELSTDVAIALMGTDITLRLQQSNGVVWEISGKDITNPMAVSMKVDLNTNAVPADKLEIFKEYGSAMQFSLAHSGAFGFKATMRFPAGGNNNGKYANLFWYNEGAFEFMGSSKVADGYAEFVFDHASDYVLVITEAAMTAVPEVKEETNAEAGEAEKTEADTSDTAVNAETVESTGSSNGLTIIVIIIAVLVIGAIAIGVIVARRRKEQ